MIKLKRILTKKVLNLLESENKKDPKKFIEWQKKFFIYLKEGIYSDEENRQQILKMSRYNTSFS